MAFCLLFTFRYFAFQITEPLCIWLVELLAPFTILVIWQLYVGKFVADLCKTRGDSKWRLTNVGTYFAKPVVAFTNIFHDASQMRKYVYLTLRKVWTCAISLRQWLLLSLTKSNHIASIFSSPFWSGCSWFTTKFTSHAIWEVSANFGQRYLIRDAANVPLDSEFAFMVWSVLYRVVSDKNWQITSLLFSAAHLGCLFGRLFLTILCHNLWS